VDGSGGVSTTKDIDLQTEKDLKAKAEADAKAQAQSALDLLAQLVGQLQDQVSMGVKATVDGAAQIGAAIGGALGLVHDTKVDVHNDLDVGANLGAVPSIDVPKIEPPALGLDGSASVVAQAQAAADGVIHG
jgi:hypothetical protein